MEPLRVCRVCGLEGYNPKDLELFAKCNRYKYGRRNICYKCRNARSRKRHADHPEKRREYLNKYREANREKLNDYNKKWREANPEKVKEKARKWREAHPEKAKESLMKYREANREMLNEKARKYNKANPFKVVLRGAKERSKRGLYLDIDLDYIKQLWDECGGICPMTGITMIKISTRNDPYTMSLDRIIPDKGYIKGNVRFVSLWYNTARSNWGDDFTVDMCRRVAEMGGSR